MTTGRLAAAALVVLLYALLCLGIVWRQRRRRREAVQRAAALAPAAGSDTLPILVAHASQTGQAEALAWQTAQALHTAGVPAQLLALSEVDATRLASTERLLVISSTYGEGDPPDAATAFARRVMSERSLSLQGLHYGVLALGDSSYRNYCGFGRQLDDWLRAAGATPLFARVEVDRGAESALVSWRHALSHLAGTRDLPDWTAPAFEPWQLLARRHLNPGSQGGPCFHLELAPAGGASLPDWQAGDLVQLQVPTDPDRPREYSVASIPADGRLHLLVRQERHPDGTLGLGSGLLTGTAVLGDALPLRLRSHSGFRIGENADRRLILIGNGTGLAGLRAHLRARAARRSTVAPAARPAGDWLVFGERQAAVDAFHRDEIADWQTDGTLARADLVFSRDQTERRYVQHRLHEAAGPLRDWVRDGAAVYVCGSLEGMAGAVDSALADALGGEALQRLRDAGRYRRDVY